MSAKWSPRRTLAFIAASGMVLWTLIIMAVRALLEDAHGGR